MRSFLAVDPLRPVAPIRQVSSRTGATPSAANRPLRVLFMAASPIGVEPVLDFEKEEAVILAAASGRVEVIVEESGSLVGLAAMLDWFGPDYFDVLHLSGHGFIGPDGPRFVMEGSDGARSDQSADDIQSRGTAHAYLSVCTEAHLPRRAWWRRHRTRRRSPPPRSTALAHQPPTRSTR